MIKDYFKRATSLLIVLCMFVSTYGTFTAQCMGLYRRSQINNMLSGYLKDVVDLDKVIDIDEKSENNEVNFSLNDGSNTVYTFSEPVWYKDRAGNMKFKDVDIKKQSNTVIKKKGYEYSNGDNDYRINFSTSYKKGLMIEYDDIEFTIIPKTGYKGNDIAGSVIQKEDSKDAFSYINLYGKGTKLVYTPQINGIKEEIILDKYTGQNKFEFIVNTKNCYIEVADGIVQIKSSKTKEVVQSFSSPFAYDSKNSGVDIGDEHYTSDCEYDVEKVTEEKYKLTLTASKDWLKSDKTVYPVVIDPVTSNINNDYDAPIYSNKLLLPNRSNATDDNIVGYRSSLFNGYYGVCRFLTKFSVPTTIKSGAKINSATYTMYQIGGADIDTPSVRRISVDAHIVTDSWNEDVLWKNAPSYNQTKISNTQLSELKDKIGLQGRVDIDITSAVDAWSNGEANNGILFKCETEQTSISNYRVFASREYSDSNCRPFTVINYTSDTTAPTVTSVTGNTQSSQWTTQAVTLTVNGATDEESGLHTLPYSFSTQEGQYNWQASNVSQEYTSPQTIYVYVRDAADNIKLCSVEKIKVDAQAPTIKSVTGNAKNWTLEDVTLTINDADDGNGAGLHETPYSFSIKKGEYDWQASNKKTFSENQTVYIYLRDKLGNIGLCQTIVVDKIDTGKPVVTSIEKTIDENSNIILTVNANDLGSGIKSYSFDNGETWQESNTKTVTSLDNIKIKVKDNAGNTAGYIPPKPTEVNSTQTTDTTTTILWTAPSDTIEIVEYKIYNGKTLVGTTKDTSYTVTGLENNKSYTFTVKAVNIFGDVSQASADINVTTGISAPENILANAGLDFIDISWDTVSGATAYDVEVGGVIYPDISSTSYQCIGLTQGTLYTVKVRAKTSSSHSSWSQEINVTTGISQEVSGRISENIIWKASNSPYIVTGDITVDSNVTLTIEPGTVIRVKDGFKIIVNGKLVANGTKDKNIVFTSYDDKNYGGAGFGYWSGIIGQGVDSELCISQSLIRYACPLDLDDNYAIVAQGKLMLVDSIIEKGLGCGINFLGVSDSVINNNKIEAPIRAINVKITSEINLTINNNVINSVVYGVEIDSFEKSFLTFNSNNIVCGVFSLKIKSKHTRNMTIKDNVSSFAKLPDKYRDYEEQSFGFFDLFLWVEEVDSTTTSIFLNNDFNNKIIADGEIVGDVLLPRGNYLLGMLTVPKDSKLIIEPGSTLSFIAGGYLGVIGELEAIGTSTMPITLTVSEHEDLNTSTSWNYWRGIIVLYSGKVKLEKVNVQKAQIGCDSSGELSISNSKFINNIKGINLTSSFIDFEELNEADFIIKDVEIFNNNIIQNNIGIEICTFMPTNITIKNNDLLNNVEGVNIDFFTGDFISLGNFDIKTKSYTFPGCDLIGRENSPPFEYMYYETLGEELVFENNVMRGNSKYAFNISSSDFRSGCLYGFTNNIFDGCINILNMFIEKDFVFPKATYEISSLFVEQNATLTIKAGSLLKQSRGGIFNEGKIIFEGTEEENIVMTSLGDPVYGGKGASSWGTILNKGEINAEYVRFKYGGMDGSNYASSCIISTGLLNITKSTFENCVSAIEFCCGSNPNSKVNFNSFVNNNLGIINCQEEQLDASYNYWGSVYGPSVLLLDEMIYYNTGGDVICGNINYEPYFANEFSLARFFGVDGTYGPTGSFSRQYTDLSNKNSISEFDIFRTYNSRNNKDTLMGRGWTFCLEASLSDYTMEVVGAGGVPQTYTDKSIKTVRLMDGSVSIFTDSGNGVYTSSDSRNKLKKVDDTYIMTTKEQLSYCFGSNGKLIWYSDKNGNKTKISYNDAGNPKSVTDYTNRTYSIAYYADNKIKSVTDTTSNRTVEYTYENGKLSQVKDSMGYKTYYTYDAENYLTGVYDDNHNVIDEVTYIHTKGANKGKVHKTTDTYGNTSTYDYDLENLKLTITDKKGNKTTQYYDDSLAITKVVDCEGKSTINEYPEKNSYYEPKSITDRNGNKTEYIRDDNGNIVQMINPDLGVKYMEYDSKNNITCICDENDKYTYFEYDKTGSNLINQYNRSYNSFQRPTANNQNEYSITSYTYYPESTYEIKGLVHTQTDALGNVTTYTYDKYGNIATVTDEENKTTTYTYNSIGLLTKTISPSGSETSYFYDNNGNEIKKVLNNGETYRTVYDNNGNVVKEILPSQYKSTNDIGGTYIADVGMRYTYYPNNLLHKQTDSNGNTTEYTYDIYGNKITEKLPNGSINRYEYDVMNRVVKSYFKETQSSEETLIAEYAYSTVTESGQNLTVVETKTYSDSQNFTTQKVYLDYENREVKIINPDNSVVINLYNQNGTLATQIDAKGNMTHYKYDDMNRVTCKYVQVSENNYSYYGYIYDLASRVTEERAGIDTVKLNSIPYSFVTKSYTYYANGAVKTEVFDDGAKTVYSYDDDGNISKKEEYTTSSKAKVTKYEYNQLGKITKVCQLVRKGDISGNDFANDETVELVTINTYDTNGNLKTTKSPSGVITQHTYDDMGNLLTSSITGVDEFGKNTTITTSTTYNEMGEVASLTDALGNITQYLYDGRGNLIKEINPLSGVTAYFYDLEGKVTAVVSPKNYKDDCELSKMNRTQYTYNAMGKIVTQTQVYYDTDKNAWTSFVEKAFDYDTNGNVIKELNAAGYAEGTGTLVSEKINSGYGTEFTYDSANQLLTELDAQDKADGYTFTQKYTYDGLGRKLTQTNAKGVITLFTYDSRNNVTSVSVKASADAPAKTIEKTTYDYLGNKLTQTDANGNKTIYTYNEFGKLAKVVFAGDSTVASITRYYQYDSVGNLAKQWDTSGKMISYTYNSQNKMLSKTVSKVDGSQAITNTYSYDVNGNLRFATDGNGVKTEYTYNSLGKKLTQTRAGKATTYTYDANGNLLKTTDWLGNTFTNEYDALNRVTKKLDPLNKVISSLKYNNNHQQISSTDALGNTTQFAYDKAGRLISTISPTGSKVEKKYDTTGNVISERDGNGNITLFTYDEFNRLISVTLPNDEITSYTYDLNGNMLTQTDARGITTTFEYNVANLRTKIIDHGGKILVDGKYVYDQSKIQSFTYTSNGLKATHTNKSGTVVSYAYDVHDRVLSKTASNKNGVQTVTYTYDKNNNLLTITDESGTITRTYDEFNRVLTKTVPKIGKTTYEYDKTESVQSGEVAEKAFYPNAQAVTKIYDKAGRLSKVVASEDTVKYNYYDNGSVKSVVYGNGAKEEYSYTPNNNLQTLTNKKTDGTIINSYSYTYDANANILSKTDEMGTTSYTYDSLNRIETEEYPNSKITAYTYDGSGNRLTEQVTTDEKTTLTLYDYDTSNKLIQTETKVNQDTTQITSYVYDANGNMIEKRITPFVDSTAQTQIIKLTNVYDLFNQLTMSITDDGKTVCNQYNGEGLRIQKSVDGVATNYLYEGMKVVAEYDKNYQLKAQNIQGNNLLMRLEKNAKYYYMYNGHADVTALLNAKTGNVDATYYYDAFGNILSKTGNVSNSYLYAGYQYDEETGLYYLNARMYDSETARFIQEDTYRGNPNDPLSLNLYTYCENNPLIYNDPTGHWPEFVNKAVKTVKQAVKKVTTKVVSSISKATSSVSKAVSNVSKVASSVKDVWSSKDLKIGKKLELTKNIATTVAINSGAKLSKLVDINYKKIMDFSTGIAMSAVDKLVSSFGQVFNLSNIISGEKTNPIQNLLSDTYDFCETKIKGLTKANERIYNSGKIVGDVAGLITGSALVAKGVVNIGLGVVGTVTGMATSSTGVGAMVGVPVVAVSGARVLVGAAEVAGGSAILFSSCRNMGSDTENYKEAKAEGDVDHVIVTRGKGQAPKSSTPNSIYEKVHNEDPSKVVSRTKYDNNGNILIREDFDHNHYDKATKTALKDHKHIYSYNDKGQRIGEKIVPIK